MGTSGGRSGFGSTTVSTCPGGLLTTFQTPMAASDKNIRPAISRTFAGLTQRTLMKLARTRNTPAPQRRSRLAVSNLIGRDFLRHWRQKAHKHDFWRHRQSRYATRYRLVAAAG